MMMNKENYLCFGACKKWNEAAGANIFNKLRNVDILENDYASAIEPMILI